MSNKASSLTYNVTSAAKGKALPTILNPVLAHRQFFAAGARGAARKDFDVDTNLLDFLADDVKRMRARLGASEREKLDRYLEAFESMSSRQSKLAGMADHIASATPAVDAKLGTIVQTKTAPTGVFDRLEAQFDIAAGAMIAGLTNVVTVSGGAGAGPDRTRLHGERSGQRKRLHRIPRDRAWRIRRRNDGRRVPRTHPPQVPREAGPLHCQDGVGPGRRTAA